MKKMKKMIGFGLALAAVSLTACGGKKEAETIRIGVVSFWRCAGRDR